MDIKKFQYGFSTRSIHVGEEPDLMEGASGDVVKPIHLSTTFARAESDIPTGGYEYSRSLNPTRKSLEEKLASLENAKYALAFASGLAAEATIILSCLKHGDHVIAFDDLYGGTKRLFNNIFHDYNIKISYTDATEDNNVEQAIQPNTKLVWIETPSNPLLKICDIKKISEITKKYNLTLVVDNTFLSPFFQNPLSLGADVVVHSSTKYIGGHSDVVSGSVMVSDDHLFEKLKYRQNAVGAILSPFDSFLVMRGIKTLSLRMERHNNSAKLISEYLESHSNVSRVIYPGLSSHPQHELTNRQATGSGGIISFELEGSLTETNKFLRNLKIFALAESLGGVESLIELPAVMTHASVSSDDRKKTGISDTLIRMSVGLEDVNDLLEDLDQSFDKVF